MTGARTPTGDPARRPANAMKPEPDTDERTQRLAAPIRFIRRTHLTQALALALIIGGALALRLFGIDWDQGQHLHPDERFLSLVLGDIRPVDGLLTYFDQAASPLNPSNHGVAFFVYGTFPLFLVEWLTRLTGLQGYDQAYLVGRAISALVDTGTVILVFVLGRRLLGIGPALLAAALMALAVHSIQLAHFFAVDTFSTFFATAALLFLVRWSDARHPRDLGLFAIAAGLAMASKLSAALLLALYALWWLAQGWKEGHLRGSWSAGGRWALQGAVAALLTALTFRLFQPYAFETGALWDWRPSATFLNAVAQQNAIQGGGYDWPPGVQWAGTTPYLFPLEQIVRWGLGPAFGLLALAGIAASGVVLWRGHAHPLGLALAWGALNFVYFGALVLKTMRYFHPIYPVLALVAAWTLAELWRRRGRLPAMSPRAGRIAVATAAALVMLGTIGWAAAFAQIYPRDHSRVAASAWVHTQIPHGAVIATEHWDDRLPLSLPGRPTTDFEFADLPVFDREDARKRAHLTSVLTTADVIVVASNRGAGSIPRMPQRYPLAARYYEALFGGELGFEPAASFTSFPSLGPWTIDDSAAEEAFTVYDHPEVSVFRRAVGDNSGLVREALASVDERGAVSVLPRIATSKQFDLSPSRADEVRTSANWPAAYADRPLGGAAAAVVWYLAALLAGLVTWPLVWRAIGWLPDAGYAAARVAGPFVVATPVWWLAGLGWMAFDTPAVVVGLAAIATAGTVAWATRGRACRPRRSGWVWIGATEAVLLAAYVGFVILRALNPDLWHPVFGGEKPMDYAHLNALVRSEAFPPHDPWYAGGQLNYYYFGHVPTAGLSKALGVAPGEAYNLGVAWYAAAAFGAIFAVGAGAWAVLRRPGIKALGVGLLSALFVLVAGNLHAGIQAVRIAGEHAGEQPSAWDVLRTLPGTIFGGDLFRDFDFWAPTRVIPETVNEFPWFTFIYGDLHPHLMNVALVGGGLIGALALVALGERTRAGGGVGVGAWAGALALQGIVLGLHRVINPWDFPTFLAVTLAALTYALWRAGRLRGRAIAATTAAAALGIAAIGQLAWWPFHRDYVDFFSGIAPTPSTTPAYQWLVVFGLPAAVVVTLMAAVLLRGRRSQRPVRRPGSVALRRPGWWGAAALAAGATSLAGLIAAGEPWSTRVWLIGIVGLTVLAMWRVRDRPILVLPAACLAAATLLTAIPEFVTVRDDIGRLNTTFKTYFQAWILLGLGAAIALPIVVARLWRHGGRLRWPRRAWAVGLAGLLVTALIYPVAATPHKLGLRIQDLPPTLDGEAFLAGGTIDDRGTLIALDSDRIGIEWIRANVAGAPTLLEGPTTIYRWGARVSVYTGLPSVVGWDWHARQQHWGYVHAVDARLDDVRELFETEDSVRARFLLDRYGVDLIYVGELERAAFAAASLEKFERMADLGVAPVFRSGPVSIYEVSETRPGRAGPVAG